MFYCLIFLFLHLFISAAGFSDFDAYQKKLTYEDVQKKIEIFLKKDPAIEAYYQLTPRSIILYKCSKISKNAPIEYELLFDPKNDQKEVLTKKSLSGLKIALDPGHFGGPYAFLEERYISIGKNQFDEGTLTLLTALYLKQLLEKEGAIVFLTKEKIGEGVYEENFFEWLKRNPKFWVDRPLNKIFRAEYNPLDLRARAEKINQFAPDLTLVLHFNSHHGEGNLSSNTNTTPSNYNMVFVPGAFCKDELAEASARYEFLRMICTDDLQNSLDLSDQILKQLSEQLKVPIVEESPDIRYLNKCCIKLKEGIFSRNLALTRLVHGPICYGETLIQNNEKECKELSKKDFVINGIPCSSRLKEVAEAYFNGIKSYILK